MSQTVLEPIKIIAWETLSNREKYDYWAVQNLADLGVGFTASIVEPADDADPYYLEIAADRELGEDQNDQLYDLVKDSWEMLLRHFAVTKSTVCEYRHLDVETCYPECADPKRHDQVTTVTITPADLNGWLLRRPVQQPIF